VQPAIVFGGYGTFGSHVARELVRLGVPVTVAGRSAERASAFARELGGACQGIAADGNDAAECCRSLPGHRVAVNCAGPFQAFDTALLDACIHARCHYADIADDRGYVTQVRKRDADLRKHGLVAAFGCSSLPGISGALALHLHKQSPNQPRCVRVTLFIGNRNPKGTAAVQSCVEGLGRPVSAPQGTLKGFRDREVVNLPLPFGRRSTFTFDTPEYDLFPALLDVRDVRAKLGFESRLGTWLLAGLARCGTGYGTRTTRWLRRLAWPFQRLGCSGGAVLVEFFDADGTVRSAAVVAREHGQRMAALPCALVARKLAEQEGSTAGALTAYDLLGAEPLIRELRAAGFEVLLPG
jgi:hypothetical protein